MYRKWIYWLSFVLVLALIGNLFAQLTFPIPEVTPGIPEDETIAYKTMVPPTINGDLSEWIDAGAVFKLIGAEDESDVFRGEWLGPEDSSILWSTMWDEDSLYFAAVVWDDIYWEVTEPSQPWLDDCIFLYFDADADGTVDNKMALFLFEEEPAVLYALGIADEAVNLALHLAMDVSDPNVLGDGGRFIEFAVPLDAMTNMAPVQGEHFGIQVGIEEGNDGAQDDQFKFIDWNGLDPDIGANLFPVTFGNLVSVSQPTNSDISSGYALEQNYPNPFNPTTTIRFSLRAQDYVKLTIYDIHGHEIITLVDTKMSAGYHNVAFDATQFASGVYFYRLKTTDHDMQKKMTLMK